MPDNLASNLTAIIKTFERPNALDRLVRSLREYYPQLHVIVADDSRSPEPRNDVEHICLPFDVGVSAGRNLLVDHVRTPYFLLLDDDFEVTADTNLANLLAIASKADVSLAGGNLLNCYWTRTLVWRRRLQQAEFRFHGLIEREADELRLLPGNRGLHDGYAICDVVQNFFVAHTESIRAMGGWDPDLKMNEHFDFFLRLQQAGVRVAHCPDVWARHWPERPSHYLKFRNRDYRGQACRKHGIRRIVNFAGEVTEFNLNEAA